MKIFFLGDSRKCEKIFSDSELFRIAQKIEIKKMNTTKTHNENCRAAIVSKYFGPTNSRGSRIVVKSQRSKKTYAYPYDLSGAECHKWAVAQYLDGLFKEDQKSYGAGATGWGTLADFSIGQIVSGEYIFVSNK